MPLPFILAAGAIVAGVAGVGAGVHGAIKAKEANDTIGAAKNRHERNLARFEKNQKATVHVMDDLGKLELSILASFNHFSDLIEKIQERPDFKLKLGKNIQLPRYDAEQLKQVSVGAGVLLGGIGGAATGTAAGFAAAGATTAAVMALGTASTGTAIASLSGIAATNAALAALGGGALAAGGGGIALGTTILGASTLGVGLLVGGLIFSVTGSKLSDKADEAWGQMIKAEKEIDKICSYLRELKNTANSYVEKISCVNSLYKKYFSLLAEIIMKKQNWNDFLPKEQEITENLVLIVSLLFNMCKVKIVEENEGGNNIKKVNISDVSEQINLADSLINDFSTINIDGQYLNRSNSKWRKPSVTQNKTVLIDDDEEEDLKSAFSGFF